MTVFNQGNGNTTTVPSATAELAYMENGDPKLYNCTPLQLAEAVAVNSSGYVTPQMFSGNDTAKINAAIASGYPIDWGNATYTHTGIDATVANMVWKSSGAKFVYDGPQIRDGFRVELGLSQSHILQGEITFDGGGTAHVAARFDSAALSDTPYADLPSFTVKNIIGKNAYRASTAFTDGDALMIAGGFQKVDIDGVIARDCYMAVGAGVSGTYGIFGLSLPFRNSRRAKHITINNYHLENIWSEDATYTNDQDGIRIFQDMADEGATCTITNGVSRNVSGRSIKLHSAPNAIVDGLHIERRSTVIPQQGLYSTPDIDCQQAPAIVKNISFVYDGVWRGSVVQNWTERGDYRYGGGLTDNIKGVMLNAAGNAMNIVSLTAILDDPPADQNTVTHANISNIAVTGAVANAVFFKVVGTGNNTVGLVNVVGDFTEGAIEFNDDTTATAIILAANVVNVGASVSFNNAISGEWDVSCVNCYGFSGVTQLTSLDGRLSGLIAGNQYFSVTSGKRMGIGDAAPDPQRALHIAQNLPHIRLSDMDAANSTEVLSFIEWYRGLTTELVGLVGYPSSASTDLAVRNEIATGDVVLLAGGNNERLRAKASGGVAANGPIGNKSYTLATLPTASSYTGHTVYVSDGVAPGIATSDGTRWNLGANNTFTFYVGGTRSSIIEAEATFTSLSYANNGGKVQLTSAGVHGLTTSPAVGESVHVTWSAGTGVTGLYTVLSVDSTTAITIELVHAVGLGTPVVALAGTEVTLANLGTVPGGSIGQHGAIEFDVMWQYTNSGNNKTPRIKFGGNTINGPVLTTTRTFRPLIALHNRGSESSQISFASGSALGVGTSASAYTTYTIDTTTNQDVTVTATPAVANEVISMEAATVIVRRRT